MEKVDADFKKLNQNLKNPQRGSKQIQDLTSLAQQEADKLF
jgi:hypothetical protein